MLVQEHEGLDSVGVTFDMYKVLTELNIAAYDECINNPVLISRAVRSGKFRNFMYNVTAEVCIGDEHCDLFPVYTGENLQYWCLFITNCNESEFKEIFPEIIRDTEVFVTEAIHNKRDLEKLENPKNLYYLGNCGSSDCRVLSGTLDEFINLAASTDSTWIKSSALYKSGSKYYLTVQTDREFGECYCIEPKITELFLKEHGIIILSENAIEKLKLVK